MPPALLIALVLALGLDTLSVSAALAPRFPEHRLRIAITFALFEAVMPLIGIGIGHLLGRALGPTGATIGAVLLVALGGYFLVARHERAPAPGPAGSASAQDFAGWLLVGLGLAISLDEVAVGISFALLGVPIVPAVLAILAQAFAFSLIGSSLGRGLTDRFGAVAERLAGVVLIGLGLVQLGRIFLGW